MKKSMAGLIATCAIVTLGGAVACALSGSFRIDTAKLLPTAANGNVGILNEFDQNYGLSYKVSDVDAALEQEIETLTKRTTYLLFGAPGNVNESSEDFYKRKQDWQGLRYAPEVPKDENGLLGLDTDSQEYQDDLVSGMTIPQVFRQANDLGLICNSYGDIRVTVGDNVIISTIVLPEVKFRVQSPDDPMDFAYEQADFVMHYYYKKLGDEWKLYYAYGESTEDIEQYFGELEGTPVKGAMAVAPNYQSKLSEIYNFDKVNNLSQNELTRIYNENAAKVIFFDSYYNNAIVTSANGFYIANGLVVTTWSFLEKSLGDAQYIIARDSQGGAVDIEGIVTINPEADLAVIKVKNNATPGVKLAAEAQLAVEDPVIALISKTGVGVLLQKGIVTADDNYLQTSIPLSTSDAGSPLFNQAGEVIGMNTAKSVNASVSMTVKVGALKEVQEKFAGQDLAGVQAVSFAELKENYYGKYDEDVIAKNIPEKVWKKYADVGKIEETIKLELVKANYQDGIVSLRYKNNISQYISGLQLAGEFREELEREGYQNLMTSSIKAVYENKKYQVIIMDEFGYLIVVMVRL